MFSDLTKDAWSEPCTVGCNYWVAAEYLLWWVKGGPVPAALVSTGPLNDLPSSTLFGPAKIDYQTFSGGRLTVGTWLDRYGAIGLEGRGFLLATQTFRTGFSSDGTGRPPLGIPFFNADTGLEDIADFSTPDQTVGKLDISSSSRLWGAESNLVFNFFRTRHLVIEGLGGFRYLGLREDLRVEGSTVPLGGQQVAFGGTFFDPPAVTTTSDRFVANNAFFGGQLGARARVLWGNAFVDIAGKLALGGTHEEVGASGASSLLTPPLGPLRTLPGGILVLPSNSGRRSDDEFTAVPEVEIKLGYQLGKHVTGTIGYNFLYWSRVARPGQQIDRNLTPGQIPTFVEFGTVGRSLSPFPVFTSTDYWAQGLTVGLEFHF